MSGRCIAVFALAFLLASCDSIVGVFRSASLQVTAYGEAGDPKGPASLEVQVDNRVFTAADLPSERSTHPVPRPAIHRGTCTRRIRIAIGSGVPRSGDGNSGRRC